MKAIHRSTMVAGPLTLTSSTAALGCGGHQDLALAQKS